MYKYKKIAYLTVYPFKDTGNVVEYFVSSSIDFFLYLFPPSYKNQPSVFAHYHQGKLMKEEKIWIYKGNNKLLIHCFYYLYYLYFLIKYRINNAHIIFYFPIFLFFKSVIEFFTFNKYVFWIWDYFPSKSRTMKIYNKVIKHYSCRMNFVIYLSPRLKEIYDTRKESSEKIREVVPFGIRTVNIKRTPVPSLIGYIGNMRPGQGLEFLLEVAKKKDNLCIQFIGEGPLIKVLQEYVKDNKLSDKIKFFGFVSNQKLVKITKRWEVAVAPYTPTKSNPTMFTDPGKIKLYIEYGIPTIMTKVSYFYKELLKYNAGVVIENNYESFIKGLDTIQGNYEKYVNGVLEVKKNYQFKRLYHAKFKFLQEI